MPRKRRSKGSGSIRKRSNRWQARFTPPSGTEVTQTFARKADAEDWLALQRTDVNSGAFVEPSDMTLGNWWVEWVAVHKVGVANSTRDHYKDCFNRIQNHDPDILNETLQHLTSVRIQRTVNTLLPLYSPRSVRMTLTVLSSVLRKAKSLKLISSNPALDIERPISHTTKGGRKIPDPDFDALIAYCKAPPRSKSDGSENRNDIRAQVYKDLILFLARHGCRPGEARALRIEKISDGWIVIDSAFDQKQRLKGTKTHKLRTIPISQDCLAMIRRREQQSVSGWLFENTNGKPIDHRSLARHMALATDGRFSPYDLRHTFCTNAVAAGSNLKAISQVTGHSIETLLRDYVHVEKADLLKIVNAHNGQIMDKRYRKNIRFTGNSEKEKSFQAFHRDRKPTTPTTHPVSKTVG